MNRSLAAALAALALVGSACGSDPDGASIDAPSGQSENQDSAGDGGAATATDEPFVVVEVALPPDTDLTGTVIISLQDVSVQDVEAIELGRVELSVDELADRGSVTEVPLESADVDLSMVTAVVHVDVDSDGELSSGDWLSTEHVPVAIDSPATVTLTQI